MRARVCVRACVSCATCDSRNESQGAYSRNKNIKTGQGGQSRANARIAGHGAEKPTHTHTHTHTHTQGTEALAGVAVVAVVVKFARKHVAPVCCEGCPIPWKPLPDRASDYYFTKGCRTVGRLSSRIAHTLLSIISTRTGIGVAALVPIKKILFASRTASHALGHQAELQVTPLDTKQNSTSTSVDTSV